MSEWFKEPVLKTGDAERHRGFESHLLRHFFLQKIIPTKIFSSPGFIISERVDKLNQMGAQDVRPCRVSRRVMRRQRGVFLCFVSFSKKEMKFIKKFFNFTKSLKLSRENSSRRCPKVLIPRRELGIKLSDVQR